MAYQHLFGSSANASMGAGYCTLASTPEFYNLYSDSELSNYNIYHFSAVGEHPIKYYHFFDEYRGIFVQSSISFEYDYAGRDSYIANSMVLTEDETNSILNSKAIPFQRRVFMNGLSEKFERPSSEEIPAVEYPIEQVDPDPENIKRIVKDIFASSSELEKFIYALMTLPMNNYSMFISLPCSAAESSQRALELMNVIIPVLPVELKKKIGFVTYTDEVSVYNDFNIYFTTKSDLSMTYIPDGYTFDFASPERTISGIDDNELQKYRELVDSFIGALLSNTPFDANSYLDRIQPKLDSYYRHHIDTYNEVYHLADFLEGAADKECDQESFPMLLTSYYKYNKLIGEGQDLQQKIDRFWSEEVKRIANDENYSTSFEIYQVVNLNFSVLSEEEKKKTIKTWGNIIVHSFFKRKNGIIEQIFDPSLEDSELRDRLISYIYAFTYWAIKLKKNGENMLVDLINFYISTTLKNYSSDYHSIVAVLKKMYDISEDPCTLNLLQEFSVDTDASERNAIFAKYFLPGLMELIRKIVPSSNLLSMADMVETLYSILGSARSICRKELSNHILENCFMDNVIRGLDLEAISVVTSGVGSINKLYGLLSRISSVNKELLSENRPAILFGHFSNIVDKVMKSQTSNFGILSELKKYSLKEQKLLSEWSLNIYKSTKKSSFLYLAYSKYTADAVPKKITSSDEFDWNMKVESYDKQRTSPRVVDLNEPNRGETVLVIDYPGLLSERLGGSADINEAAKFFDVVLGSAADLKLCEDDARQAVYVYISEKYLDPSMDKKTLKENERVLNDFERIEQLLKQNASTTKHGISFPFLKKK